MTCHIGEAPRCGGQGKVTGTLHVRGSFIMRGSCICPREGAGGRKPGGAAHAVVGRNMWWARRACVEKRKRRMKGVVSVGQQ